MNATFESKEFNDTAARIFPERYWTTAGGERMPIAAMNDRHLYNTIRMIHRHRFEIEMGVIASVCDAPDSVYISACQSEPDELLELAIPQWPVLLEEATSRQMRLDFMGTAPNA